MNVSQEGESQHEPVEVKIQKPRKRVDLKVDFRLYHRMSELETTRSSDFEKMTGVPRKSIQEKQRQIAQNFTIFDDLVTGYCKSGNKHNLECSNAYYLPILQWQKTTERPLIAYTKKMFQNQNQQGITEKESKVPPPEFDDSKLKYKHRNTIRYL